MRVIPILLALVLLAGAASALEGTTDTSKISATTVSYGGSTFILWQGYITVTLTNNGVPASGWDVRLTALNTQVSSVETTNSTGKAVLPYLTDIQPSLIHVEVRSSSGTVFEDCCPPGPVEPKPTPTPPPQVGNDGPPGGGPGPAGAAPPAAAPAPRSTPAVLGPPAGPGLSPGGLFNVISGGSDWSLPGVPAAPEAVPEAAPAGLGLAQAVALDILMVGGAVGYALFVRVRPGRAR